MSDHQSKRLTPLLILILSNCISIITTLIGLMSVTQSQINWKTYFLKGIEYYREFVTDPIKEQIIKGVLFLEKITEWTFDWIPWWLPDYIPIASTFSIGITVGYCYLKETNPIKLVNEFILNDLIPAMKEDFFDTITIIIMPLIFFLLLFFFSPVLYIVIPGISILLFCIVLLFFSSIIFLFLKYLTKPAIFTVVFLIPSLSLIWILINRKNYFSFLRGLYLKIKTFIPPKYNDLKQKGPQLITKAKGKLSKEVTEFSVSLKFFVKLVWYQYLVAGFIFVLFLIAYALNSCLVYV